ncbi:hypothetical protein MBLNU230_g1683t1 [Neophaeotheca triangularis]
MPLYEIHHTCPLTLSQRTALAERITQIHTTKFTTPSLFVQVKYHQAASSSEQATPTHFIAGRPKFTNAICIYARAGPSRTKADLDDLCLRVEGAWVEVVGKGLPSLRRGEEAVDTGLGGGVVVVGGILAGREHGFALPEAGQDVEWLRENMGEFERRAAEGDEEMVELVKEVKGRGLLGSGKTKMQELEEALGWGDYA